LELNWRKDAESLKEVKRLSAIESDILKENKAIFLLGYWIGREHKAFKNVDIYFRPPNEYPDAILFDGDANRILNVEFESISSNFKRHKHDLKKCDLIVCLVNDYAEVWKEPCPLPVYEMLRGKLMFPKKK